MIVAEGIAAGGIDGLDARFDQRFARRGERQFDDDDVAQRVSANIDALPESVGAENDSLRALSQSLDHRGASQPLALNEQVELGLGKSPSEQVGELPHHVIAGEQHQRSATGLYHEVFDAFGSSAAKSLGFGWGGQVGLNVHIHLLAEVVRRVELEPPAVFESDSAAVVLELRIVVDRERGRRENDGLDRAEQRLP